MLSSDYNPFEDSSSALWETTDSTGRFAFDGIPPGDYTISASANSAAYRWFSNGIGLERDDAKNLEPGILLPTRTGTFPLPSDSPEGYAFIPGLDIIGEVTETRDSVVLVNMPQGRFDSLLFCAVEEPETKQVIARSLSVSEDTTVFTPSEHFYTYSTLIHLNTTADAANVSETVYSFPVLVGLNEQNFDFTQTREDGSDLYFSKTDGTPIPFEIEEWIVDFSRAVAWVLIDTLHGDSEQTIRMHWGNPGIVSQSRSVEVFDTANDFVSVWHLEEFSVGADGAPNFRDATYNAFHGLDYVSAGGQLGLIGYGQDFNGPGDHIEVGHLAIPYSNPAFSFTLSCWFNIDRYREPDLTAQYFMELIDTAIDMSYWRLFTTNQTEGASVRVPISFSLQTDSGEQTVTGEMDPTTALDHWRFVVVSVTGNEIALYENGTLSRREKVDGMPFVTYSQPVLRIGRNDATTIETKGSIDELRISSTTRSDAWIKLCFENQRPDNKLVSF